MFPSIKGGLTRLHYEIIDDLFERGLPESEVNARYGLPPGMLRKWICDPAFDQEVRSRMHATWSGVRIKLARFVPEAANKLIELAQCEKEETRRKACLDVIAMLLQECSEKGIQLAESPLPPLPFSDKTALWLLAMYAKEEGQPVSDAAENTDSAQTPA